MWIIALTTVDTIKNNQQRQSPPIQSFQFSRGQRTISYSTQLQAKFRVLKNSSKSHAWMCVEKYYIFPYQKFGDRGRKKSIPEGYINYFDNRLINIEAQICHSDF